MLFESAAGYALFERVEGDELSVLNDQVQKSIVDLGRFSKVMKLKAFCPFATAEQALQNQNDISEGRHEL